MSNTHIDIAALRDVLARLEKATGPDRELDGAIEALMYPPGDPDWRGVKFIYGDWCRHFQSHDKEMAVPVPNYLSSLDAVEALRKRVLPFIWFASGSGSDGEPWCTMPAPLGKKLIHVKHQTECLARLTALFRALIAREEGR